MDERKTAPATEQELATMDAYWRAANYLSACQLYLLDDPLLQKPLTEESIKKKIVGHWGTVPGQNFIYTHLNRVIKKYDLDMIYVSGPGHGGNAMVAQDWLDGSYQEVYPNISRDKEGMQKLFKQFSFPGGIPSHVAPETPGSINEGGELGYSLAHSFGAVTDNPGLIAACVVGDGEAETGPLATSWHLNKFINAKTDGAVLPILHLNGYKIANPTLFARISHEELEDFFRGCGWEPHFVEGKDPAVMHRLMADTLDECIEEILAFQKDARENGSTVRPRWPMIVLRSPKGWTGPAYVDGLKVEDYWRAHQVPIQPDSPEHIRQIEEWLKSYRPEELFDENGVPVQELLDFPPKGTRRMGANPHANGGLLLKDLRMPDFREYGVDVSYPGAVEAQDMSVLGTFVRDIYKLNEKERSFRSFGPDETTSNRLSAVFEETDRAWDGEPSRARWQSHGLHALRARLRGSARGLPADRPPRLLQQLRGLHPHRRLHVLPARQVAQGLQPAALAPEDRVAQLLARIERMAAGPQRLHASGSRLPRPCREQEGRRRPPLPAPGCKLPAQLL